MSFRLSDGRDVVAHLAELDRRDFERKVFGSNGHQYKLRPPLPVSVIEDFEKQHGVALPLDYRYFITEIGNGGAGPSYGVFPFGQHDANYDYCDWDSGGLVGDPSKPFEHVGSWNLPASFWDSEPDIASDTPVEVEDRLMEAWDKELDEKYWNPSLLDGAIPICHLGCAYRQWLVVKGVQQGYVWNDDRVDNRGLYPLIDAAGNQMTFSSWYMSWLKQALRTVGLTNKPSD